MATKLKKCASCGRYTMKASCQCGAITHTAHPAKYSEKFGKYRRIARAEDSQ